MRALKRCAHTALWPCPALSRRIHWFMSTLSLQPPFLTLAAAGDALFRVVERKELAPGPSGARRVEVVNQAAIRVLAWKLWSRSSVVYEIGRPENGSQQQWVQFELVASVGAPWTGGWQQGGG